MKEQASVAIMIESHLDSVKNGVYVNGTKLIIHGFQEEEGKKLFCHLDVDVFWKVVDEKFSLLLFFRSKRRRII